MYNHLYVRQEMKYGNALLHPLYVTAMYYTCRCVAVPAIVFATHQPTHIQAALLAMIVQSIHRAKGNCSSWTCKVQVHHSSIYMCMSQQFFDGKNVYTLL